MTPQTSSKFSSALKDAFNHAWQYLITNHTKENIRHINESVFRYWIIQYLMQQRHNDISIDDEWKRIDLLLRDDNCQAAIEFKFYDSRPFHPISGSTTYKGGAGSENYKEFKKSLKILTELNNEDWYKKQKANITEQYFILIGTKHQDNKPNRDFSTWYYPATDIKIDFCELKIIEQKYEALSDIQIFGWLCNVIKKEE